jgi:ABC-type multidrug transport system fused ATPase/permease subunit
MLVDTYVAPRRFAWLLSFYGGLCRKVLADGRLFSGFLLAAALQALGHGAMALVAGLLGRSLATGTAPTFRALGQPLGATTLALVGLIGACLKWAGTTFGATAQSQLAQKVTMELRRSVATRLLSEGSSLSSGHLSARLSVALREVEVGVQEGFLAGLRSALALLPLLAALLWMSSRAVIAALVLVLPIVALMTVGRRLWKARHADSVAIAEALHRELDELVAHMDVWRTYGAGQRVCSVLDRLGARAMQSASAAERGRAFLSGANEVLAAAALLVGFAVADRAALPGVRDGQLVGLAVIVFMSYRPLRELGDAGHALERGSLAVETLTALAAPVAPGRLAEAPIDPGAAPPVWPSRTLFVRELGVCRGGVGSADALASRISFTAAPGEIVAITGPTGAGKTTLLRAMLGLERETTGSLCYGDVDLGAAAVGPAARPFAWMAQDAPLLSGTLEDNLLLETPDGALDALAPLGAEGLTEQLGQQHLGASGRSLSGGERKWVALARAVATGLPVLLLDEPTAGLDPAAEGRVLQALVRLRNSRTTILVSHQPRPLAIADRVVHIGGGDPQPRAEGSLASELREEPGIVLEQDTNVGDVVAQHGHPFDPDTEGEPGVAFGVDPGVLEDDGMNHPAAEHLDETGVLA